jgi:hypothetical protein
MILVAELLMAVGGLALLASVAFALLARPRRLVVPASDTVLFEPLGPSDGELVRVKGRVVVETTVRAPSGADCALYELYAGEAGAPARALRQRGVRFLVDDGVQPIAIDPSYKVIAFDLPTAVVDGPQLSDRLLIVRHLSPGAQVEAIGRVWRHGAPGHEEITLLPPDPHGGVAITFLGV